MQAWRLGSYELIRRLGEGGMAQVYLARDVRLGREVAVKVLDQRLAERPGFRERFLREARVAAALDHPNIVPLYDFGDSDQLLYLVMPFVSGGSLQDMLHRAPFPAGEVATYGSQMADALDYAHQRNVIHRDVKPANMLLHADGRVLLSDFGLAKIVNPSSRPAAPRGHPDAGTPEYMAPEQIEGRSDERSDVYALGVVLYLLLTGHLPFTGSSSSLVMEGHLYRLPQQPRMLNSAITPAMQAVVLRALAKHPDDRFQHASELGAALLGALIAGDSGPMSFVSHASSPPLSRPPLAPRISRGPSGASSGWEPPVVSPAPQFADEAPLPSLNVSYTGGRAGLPASRATQAPRRRSTTTGALAPHASYGSSSSGRMPRVSGAPAVPTGPMVSRPPVHRSASATPLLPAAPRPPAPTSSAAAPAPVPMPQTTGTASTRISIRAGMSQWAWLFLIAAILLCALLAGILLQRLRTEGQPASMSRPAVVAIRSDMVSAGSGVVIHPVHTA